MLKILFICSLFLVSGGDILSQDKNIIDFSIFSVSDSINKNSFTVFINIEIKKGWHLNSHNPMEEYLTPTTVKLKDTSGIKVVNIEYPPEVIKKLQFSDSDLSLYEGMVTIKVHLSLNDEFVKNKRKVKLEIEYQSCNNQTCLFPVQKNFVISL
jgi:DsbC/DsbD-like thiol-disulfide interchange protein